MAISIDTVYQRVLVLANKEQRGYITPQEFNLLANQAQQELFEAYVYDLNQRKRLEPEKSRITGEEDVETLLEEKLAPFMTVLTILGGTVYPDNYTIGKIFVGEYECEKLPRNEVLNIMASSRHLGLLSKSPIYCDSAVPGQDILVVSEVGQTVNGVNCEVVTKPPRVTWDYVIVDKKALYNPARTIDFMLHDSEETNLVIKILQLAGISMKDSDLYQIGLAEDNKNIQQEKQ